MARIKYWDMASQSWKYADQSIGNKGTSITHSWDGTTLIVTSASGTSSANLKGEKGDKGDKGDTGPTGATGKPAYQYAKENGYTGTETEFGIKLAKDIPAITQQAGQSESLVMSQKAVTDLVAETIGSGLSAQITKVVDQNSTNDQIPTAKAVYDFILGGNVDFTGEVNNLAGKNWLAFGDSVTGLGYNYATIISKLKNCNLHRSCRGGQTLAYGHGENSAIYQFTAETPTNSSFVYDENYKPDFITILYGINDAGAQSPIGSLDEDGSAQTPESYSFIGCYCAFIRAIIAKWGYVPIYLITPPQGNALREQFAQATIDVARHFALPVYDYYHESAYVLGNKDFTVDGTHTSQKGSEWFAHRLFRFLNEREGILTTNPYTITYNLTNVKLNGYALPVDSGERYYGENIYAASDAYVIDSVTVTMGGKDITETAYDRSTGRVTIDSVTGDVVVTASAVLDESHRSITYELSNVTLNNTIASVEYNGTYTTKLSCESGYVVDSITVTMGGEDITETAYDRETGTITIDAVTGNVTITALAVYTVYTVTNALTNSINSNVAISAVHGSSYNATVSAEIGYELESVTVTMGGKDITETAYSDGAITIAKVTGNVVVTAVSTESAVQPVYVLYNYHLDGTNGFSETVDVLNNLKNDFTILYAIKNPEMEATSNQQIIGFAGRTQFEFGSLYMYNNGSPYVRTLCNGTKQERYAYMCISWDAANKAWSRGYYSGTQWMYTTNNTGNNNYSDSHDYALRIGQNCAYDYNAGGPAFAQSEVSCDISVVIYDTKDISSNIMKTFVDTYG